MKKSIALIAVLCSPAFADALPNPDVWTEVYNPGGDRVVPLLVYDRVSGVLSIDTLGLNRVDDTPDYSGLGGPILGDDVAAADFRISVSDNARGGDFFPFFDQNLSSEQNLFFNSATSGSSYITTTVPLLGNGNVFLWPDAYSWLQLPTGLDQDDFHSASIFVYFNAPGAISTSVVSVGPPVAIVPEPSHLSWVFIAIAPLLRRGLRY